jgi:glutamine amidotransferase
MVNSVILNYGLGNPKSVQNILRKVGQKSIVSSKKEDIESCDVLIIPGVGHFAKAMELMNESGLSELIIKHAELGKPVIGICLGMQLLCSSSEEGDAKGLGLFDAEVLKFKKTNADFKIPNIGWLNVKLTDQSLIENFPDDPRFYFTHSYYVNCKEKADILMESSYGIEYTVGIRKNNIYGFQFHPEKSHAFGIQLFTNLYAQLNAS